MRRVVCMLLLLAEPALARERAPVEEFRKTHPCPSTGKTEGACPGYVVDHKYPLCAGGADDPSNMQWEPREHSYTKDRLEPEVGVRIRVAAL